ncbi:MAG: VOC family protein [Mycobacteriales bacterium]
MAMTIHTVSADCRNAWKLAHFWAALLDWTVDDDNAEGDDEVGITPRVDGPAPLLFIEVSEPKAIKNRIHLDLKPDDQAAEVERALALGAMRTDVGQTGDESWVVMSDPEGNEFCILKSG